MNGSMTSVSGLRGLEVVEGGALVATTDLENLAGFESLTRVGANLDIPSAGFEDLRSIDHPLEIGGWLVLGGALESLAGIENFQLTGGLSLKGLENDVDLSALSAFTSLTNLEITGNPRLRSLDGLENLTTVTEALYIWQWCIGLGCQNSVLTDLHGLRGLASVGLLMIFDNPALPTCGAEWLRDSVGIANIGTLRIEGNDDLGTCPP